MSSPQHEPTMEEILASIRKIISEDAPAGETPAPVETGSASETVSAPAYESPTRESPTHESDVLELTQEVVETPRPTPPPPAPAAPVTAPAAATPVPTPDNDVVFQTIEEPMTQSHDGIFSDSTRKAMDDTFAGIPDEPAPPVPHAAAPLVPAGGASVENVFERAVRESFEPVLQKYLDDNSGPVIERMKPLIREWMDEHFPALLEGAVRAEVERVVKARGAKR